MNARPSTRPKSLPVEGDVDRPAHANVVEGSDARIQEEVGGRGPRCSVGLARVAHREPSRSRARTSRAKGPLSATSPAPRSTTDLSGSCPPASRSADGPTRTRSNPDIPEAARPSTTRGRSDCGPDAHSSPFFPKNAVRYGPVAGSGATRHLGPESRRHSKGAGLGELGEEVRVRRRQMEGDRRARCGRRRCRCRDCRLPARSRSAPTIFDSRPRNPLPTRQALERPLEVLRLDEPPVRVADTRPHLERVRLPAVCRLRKATARSGTSCVPRRPRPCGSRRDRRWSGTDLHSGRRFAYGSRSCRRRADSEVPPRCSSSAD